MKKLLWLDDYRDPYKNDWLIFSPVGKNVDDAWATSYEEFKLIILVDGLPDAICFDHDLGTEKTGYDCAKWLVEYCINNNLKLPLYASQSANPVGKENILKLLENYEKSM